MNAITDIKPDAQIPAEPELTEGQKTTLGKMATMLLRGVTSDDVAKAYMLEPLEFEELLKTKHFKSIYSNKQRDILEQEAGTDHDWDKTEQLAIQRLTEKVPVTHDPAVLLRIASVANGAKRKKDKFKDGVVDGSSAAKPATVNIQINQAFMRKLPNMDIKKEYVMIAHNNSVRKQHDSLSTEIVTDLLEHEGEEAAHKKLDDALADTGNDVMAGWL